MKLKKIQTCSTNRVVRYIRIGLSLAVVGFSLYKQIWFLAILGGFTLISALSGQCSMAVKFDRD